MNEATNEHERELFLLREKPPNENDGNHTDRDEAAKTTRLRRDGGGCVAVAVVCLSCYWTISCTKLDLVVRDLVRLVHGMVHGSGEVILS